MTTEDWARLKRWFGEALEAEPGRRAQILARLHQESPELALELDSLLAAHESHSLATQRLDVSTGPLAKPELFPQGLPMGACIGPYRVLRELGRGGSGVVFLAERTDDEFHRPVALKLLRFAEPAQPGASGLTRERGSLARMQHTNIASLLDWGTSPDGVSWLATEFIPGEPIDAYCRSRKLGEAAILDLFAQVNAAVAYAHHRGVVHRDLKPGNILVNSDGLVKLLDFGIAQSAEAGPDRSLERTFTPDFASPEQLTGEPATPASDVYSLAVVLRQLLANAMPPGHSRTPSRLARILGHALEPEMARRCASVELFQADLARYACHRPPRSLPTPWPQRAWLFARRHRLKGAFTLLALGVPAVLVIWFQGSARSRSSLYSAPAIAFSSLAVGRPGVSLPLSVAWPHAVRVHSVAVVTQGAPGLDFTSPDAAACMGAFHAGSSCVMHVHFSPIVGGKRMGAVIFRGENGSPLSIQYLDGIGHDDPTWIPTAVPTPERVISGLNFARGLSTDGSGNAYFVEAYGNTVDEIPADGSPLRILAHLPVDLMGGATAVDGAGIIYFTSEAAHEIFALRGGTPVPIASLPSAMLLDNSLAVDGAGNLYVSGVTGSIYMIEAGSRKVVRLVPGDQGHRFVALASDLDGNLFCPDYLSNALYELSAGSTQFVPLVAPGSGNLLDQPHAVLTLTGGELLVGNDRLNAHILHYAFAGSHGTTLPILGNQSLALFGRSRLFAVVNNTRVYVYRLIPTERRQP